MTPLKFLVSIRTSTSFSLVAMTGDEETWSVRVPAFRVNIPGNSTKPHDQADERCKVGEETKQKTRLQQPDDHEKGQDHANNQKNKTDDDKS